MSQNTLVTRSITRQITLPSYPFSKHTSASSNSNNILIASPTPPS
jgi:hypothetical protein